MVALLELGRIDWRSYIAMCGLLVLTAALATWRERSRRTTYKMILKETNDDTVLIDKGRTGKVLIVIHGQMGRGYLTPNDHLTVLSDPSRRDPAGGAVAEQLVQAQRHPGSTRRSPKHRR